jgi:hypothetical protein
VDGIADKHFRWILDSPQHPRRPYSLLLFPFPSFRQPMVLIKSALFLHFLESNWKDNTKDEALPEWANSPAVEMDWNKLQK